MGYKPPAARVEGRYPALKHHHASLYQRRVAGRRAFLAWAAQVLMTLIEGGLTSASTIWRVIISKGLCKKPA